MLHTFPTAASPRRTSFTLLLGLGAVASAILRHKGTFGLMNLCDIVEDLDGW
jgi:hypothetical protein